MKLILIILLVFPCIKALDFGLKKDKDKNREGKGIHMQIIIDIIFVQ